MTKTRIIFALTLSACLTVSGCAGVTGKSGRSISTSSADIVENEYSISTEQVDDLENSLDFYRLVIDDSNLIEIIDAKNLSAEKLENRNGKLIIERIIGVVENPDGDGKILNPNNPEQNYICYAGIDGIQEGDVIATYCIYNPDNNYIDDIIERFDYVIDEK